MEAIRRKQVKRTGNQVIIELPDSFTAEKVDVVLWPSDEEREKSESEIEAWRKDLIAFYADFNVDLSNLKYTRDELYDRP